jgi:tetratricopeptide (TPR) repeat protein
VNLATAKYYLEKYSESKKILGLAMKMDTDFANAYNVMGMVHTSLEDYQTALENFNRGLALKSNDALMLNNRGFVYLMIGDHERALKDINESIVINPDNPWTYRNKAIYYQQSGDGLNAERLFLQSIKMDETIALSHFYLGNIYLQRGDHPKACAEFSFSEQIGDKEGVRAHRQHCQ